MTAKVLTQNSKAAIGRLSSKAPFTLFNGDTFALLETLPDESVDLIVSSPPYCIGKEYESTRSIEDFQREHEKIAPQLARVLKHGGSLCWQVGVHATRGAIVPLDYFAFGEFARCKDLVLRNRIVWHFEHGVHSRNRFSGRYETVLWFSKGDSYTFNLDSVRVPQKYPGKRHYKGPKKGQLSGNPMGKNPGDVWAIPNVSARHREKTAHPCQFPIGLPQRLVRALSAEGQLVFDPYAGVASTGMAAALERRRFLGAEISVQYCNIALARYSDFLAGELKVRDWQAPIVEPDIRQKVAQRPSSWKTNHGNTYTTHPKREKNGEVRLGA